MAALTWSLGKQVPCQRNVWWPAKGEVEGRQRKPWRCLVRAFGWILAILEIDWWKSVLMLHWGTGWKREQSRNWHEPICWHMVPQSTNPWPETATCWPLEWVGWWRRDAVMASSLSCQTAQVLPAEEATLQKVFLIHYKHSWKDL